MKKLKIIDLNIIALLLAAISSVLLRSFALFNSFNSTTMHFEESVAIVVSNIIVVLFTLAFISYLFWGKTEEDLIAKTDNAASYIPAGIVSTAMLFMGVNLLGDISSRPSGILHTLSLIAAIFSFLSVGSFFLTVFIEKRNDIYKSAFSLCVVFFLAIYASYLYFNKEIHPTNSPNKLVDQMAYLFSAAFFLYEARIPLGRAKWRGYVAFGLAASLLTAYSSIPSLIVYAVNGYIVSDSLIESALTLALFIFITSKVIQTKKLTSNTECSVAKSIAALAMMREEEIKEQRKLSHERHSNEMEEKDEGGDAPNYTFDIPYIETSTDFNPEGADIDINNPYQE